MSIYNVPHKATKCLIFTLVILIITGCSGKPEALYQPIETYDEDKTYTPADQWELLIRPELAGWSPEKLEEARAYASEIHSSAVVVVHKGVLIGAWGEVDELLKLYSVRKSLLSAMIGLAVKDGMLSLDDTLAELNIDDNDELTDAERRATVFDLITARSGVYHPAAYETSGMREKRPARGSHEPGTFWYYNNWDFNALVSIFNTATSSDFFVEFENRIADKIEMEHFTLKDTRYYFEEEYSEHPAYLFRMSALDLARFGLLYLREGNWNGEQLVPASWVRASQQKHVAYSRRNPALGYGYMWWIKSNVYYAAGTGGQRLFIDPEHDLVIAHRSNTDKGIKVRSKRIAELNRKILAALQPDANQ